MDATCSAALDRHITGNYGEDQFAGEEAFESFLDDSCSKCQFVKDCQFTHDIQTEEQAKQCPLLAKIIADEEEARQYWAEMEDAHWMEQDRDDKIDKIMERRKRLYYSRHPDQCPYCMGARWFVEKYEGYTAVIFGKSQELYACPICNVSVVQL